MAAPEFLTQGGDATTILLGLPLLGVAAYVGNKFLDADDEGKARLLIGAGSFTLAVALLFSGVCEGDKRGVCRYAPEAPW